MGKRIVRRCEENFKARIYKIVEDRGSKIENRTAIFDAILDPQSSILDPLG